MDLTLRSATELDIPFLLALREMTMESYLAEVGMPTDKADYLSRIQYQFEHAKIIEVDGDAAGLFKAYFDELEHVWHLVQIQVHPSHQGKRIGHLLISDLLDKARQTPVNVLLSVIKVNLAKRLYDRLGFTVYGETDGEYLMQWLPK